MLASGALELGLALRRPIDLAHVAAVPADDNSRGFYDWFGSQGWGVSNFLDFCSRELFHGGIWLKIG